MQSSVRLYVFSRAYARVYALECDRLCASEHCKLQQAGVIEYERGKITVLDRLTLEARVCEGYAVVRKEYDRLLHVPALLLRGALRQSATALGD